MIARRVWCQGILANSLAIAALLTIFLVPAHSRAENYLRTDTDGRIFAKLERVPMLEIAKLLQDAFAIEVSGGEDLLQNELSANFNGLSLDRALNRLFHNMNVIIEYNGDGRVTEIRFFSSSGGPRPSLARKAGSGQTLSNNFKEIYAVKMAARETLNFAEPSSANGPISPEMPNQMDHQAADMAAFKVEPNTPPVNPAVIDPSSIPKDDTFKVERNANPSGKDFQIVPSAPPSRRKT